jgi:hypothetical protein
LSHSTCLVIGPDYEKQLEPFDENLECEPRREEVTLEDVQRLLEHYHEHPPGAKTKLGQEIRKRYGRDPLVNFPIVIADGVIKEPDYSLVRSLAFEWFGKELFKDEQGFYNYTRYNPKSKWDWYSVGGRWTGYFKLKPGCRGSTGRPGIMTEAPEEGWVDQCLKAAVDIAFMRDEAADRWGKHWDTVHAAVAAAGQALDTFETWDDLRSRIAGAGAAFDRTKMDEARKAYGAQPIVQATRKLVGVFESDDVIVMSREAWVQRARDGALTPFAVLKDGEWYERGEMGWWGMAHNEKVEEEWNEEFNKLFDALPDDTELTIVDVHI